MISGLWGKKIGMTQVFAKEKAIPVTVIDVSGWFITQVKTEANDGYVAVQIAQPRDRFRKENFSSEWLKDAKKYFQFVREVKLKGGEHEFVVGQPAVFHSALTEGGRVNVVGVSKGHGFQGTVKRHGFTGGRASHGSKIGRRPGSLSFMRSQGRVIKGKRLPGHMGGVRHMIRHLELVKVHADNNLLLIKGSVPGKSGSLVYVQQA